jgi:glycosyltransferase involved in cell wall biosynthesis
MPAIDTDLRLQPVVVIPTYQNGSTVTGIVRQVLKDGWRCIVVDDGSTDQSDESLLQIRSEAGGDRLDVLRHDQNQGKAAALHTGFDHARAFGASHAITLDADGQHDPEQITDLWMHGKAHPEAIVLGERPYEVEGGTPWRSKLGRSVTNTLIRLQCGVRINDSQTGFRVYPLDVLEKLNCTYSRFAFESEIIIRAGRSGVEVTGLPIHSRYFPPEERISHFKPICDSAHSLLMQATMLGSHHRVAWLFSRWFKRQVLYLPLFIFLLIGFSREGLSPEAQWHPAFLFASAAGLLVLLLWRRLGLGYEPVAGACLLFLFGGTFGVLMKGTSVYPLIHNSYGALEEIALLLWVAGVCVVLAVVRPAWLLGLGELPRTSARYDAWALAGVSIAALLIGMSLHSTHAALAGSIPFVLVILAQIVIRRRVQS